MQKQHLYKYYKRIVLSEKRITELNSLLAMYYCKLRYTAIVKDGSELRFDSFEELKNHDNFKENEIKQLIINGDSINDEIKMTLSPQSPYKEETIVCRYTFSNLDKEKVFRDKITSLFDKAEEATRSYQVCRILSFVALVAIPCIVFRIVFKGISGDDQFAMYMFAVILGLLAYGGFDRMVIQYFFPKVYYAWGEGEKIYNDRVKLRYALFWSVIVAAIVAIIVGIIL